MLFRKDKRRCDRSSNTEISRILQKRRRADTLDACLHKVASGVLDAAKWNAVLLRINEFDVTNALQQSGESIQHSFVALGSEPNRPTHRSVGAHLRLPLGTDLRRVVSPDIGRAAAVRAMSNNDRNVGKLNVGIDASYLRVAPFCGYCPRNMSASTDRRKSKFAGDSGHVSNGSNLENVSCESLCCVSSYPLGLADTYALRAELRLPSNSKSHEHSIALLFFATSPVLIKVPVGLHAFSTVWHSPSNELRSSGQPHRINRRSPATGTIHRGVLGILGTGSKSLDFQPSGDHASRSCLHSMRKFAMAQIGPSAESLLCSFRASFTENSFTSADVVQLFLQRQAV